MLLKLLVSLLLTLSGCHGDYQCLCNYDVERPVFPVADDKATAIGYMYEFDCKESITSYHSGNYVAIAFEKQLGYIRQGPNQPISTCQGEPSMDDKIPQSTKHPGHATSHIVSTTKLATIKYTTPSSATPPVATVSLKTDGYTTVNKQTASTTYTSSTNTYTQGSVTNMAPSTTLSGMLLSTSSQEASTRYASSTPVPIITNPATPNVYASTTAVPVSTNQAASNVYASTTAVPVSTYPAVSTMYASTTAVPASTYPAASSSLSTIKSTPSKSTSSVSTLFSILSTSSVKTSSSTMVSTYSESSSAVFATTSSADRPSTTSGFTQRPNTTTSSIVTQPPTDRVDLCPYKLLSDSPFVDGGYPYWGQRGHYCYELRPNIVDYNTAKKDCNNRRGTLLMVPSKDVEHLILDLLTNTRYQHPVWLGLTKNGQNWVWNNGTALSNGTYTNWNTGQEDTFARDCAVLDGYDGGWRPVFCQTFITETGTFPYFCQYRIDY